MKRVCLITILPKIRAERSAGEVGAPGRGPAVRPPWAQADFPSQTGSVARGPRKGVPAFGASCANWNKLMGRVRPSPALQRGFEALSGIVCQFVTGRNRPLLVPHCAPEERPPPPRGGQPPACAQPPGPRAARPAPAPRSVPTHRALPPRPQESLGLLRRTARRAESAPALFPVASSNADPGVRDVCKPAALRGPSPTLW